MQAPADSAISVDRMEWGMKVYLGNMRMDLNLANLSLAAARSLIERLPTIAPAWQQDIDWALKLARTTLGTRPGAYDAADGVSFAQFAAVLEVINEKFGRFQNQECIDLKKTLISM